MAETIGFIGLGIMGRPMAHNLRQAGYALIVDDRHQEVTAEFTAAGARTASRPAEIAAASDVVITMLPGPAQVEEVLCGAGGVSAGAHAGLVAIDMSTTSPLATSSLAARLAEHGIRMLDAPVGGGDQGAIAGTLSIMVGGGEDTFKRCYGVPLPVTAQVDQIFASLEANGHGDLDHSALLLYLEELASHRVGQS